MVIRDNTKSAMFIDNWRHNNGDNNLTTHSILVVKKIVAVTYIWDL